MASFPQPILDKSLVNYDIRGARAKYIEKEVKLYEREQKSPPIPQKYPEDYIVNTRHGNNPVVQKAKHPNYEVRLPQGQSSFDAGGKKHYFVYHGEIKEKRSLENPYNLPPTYEFVQQYYPRNLNIQDIEGTVPGSLGNKVVKNKEQAKKLIQKDKSEIQQLQDLQKNPYEKYLDALDKFKSEMNQGQSGEFKDRHHFIVNPDNPYAPVDHPRYNNQGNQNKENTEKNSATQEKVLGKESNQDRQQQKPENNKKYYQDDESYKPRQFRDENKLQNFNSQQEIKEQQFKSQEQNQDYKKQLEYERIIQEYEKEKKLAGYKAEQQSFQKEREYQYDKNNEISLLNNEKRSNSPYQREQQGIRQSGRQSPEIDYRRQGLQSQYKSQPNLLKLNHQQDIISHAINNISPQITKQNLAPNLNLEGYIQYGKGARLNPTSMSYVGTELANKNITLTHNLLGNQIIAKEKMLRGNQKDNLRYTHTQLNFQKFEKYPGEFMDLLKEQGKPVTNENLFQLQYERANAPKSTMETLIKYPVNVYEKGEGNLDHYKRETVALPQQREIPSEYQQPLKNNSILQQRQNDDSVEYKQFKNNTPFGAPFSYNPNEYKKKEMVALNHSKQLEKIEQMMDKADKQIDNIQRSSPDIQQPHIKKTLNPEHYAEIISQIRAEEEEKARNKMEYERYLEQKHEQESFAGLGSYGDIQRQKDQKQNQSMEYIQQYGAKGLRNLSNVRIF
ncbi:hypothetical protein ABPG72_006997 [Tetrahymena utriculariae]